MNYHIHYVWSHEEYGYCISLTDKNGEMIVVKAALCTVGELHRGADDGNDVLTIHFTLPEKFP